MKSDLSALIFGLPSFIVLTIVFYVGVVHGITNIIYFIKTKDYNNLLLFIVVTLIAYVVGTSVGDYLINNIAK